MINMKKQEVLQKIEEATDTNEALVAMGLAAEHCPSLLRLAMMQREVLELKLEAANLRNRANLKEIEMAGASFYFREELKKESDGE